ncbi:glycoside hydrolase domain-containing protein [Streptomyces anandii]|uniref:glycoside hydrolase domain-containing protein n=1 Tax=Streptomyces anandii TaxID=285454 RepID=UPI00167AE1CF|nr:glycoside hydrolase domain-containing protein [Streptomyces anandii]
MSAPLPPRPPRPRRAVRALTALAAGTALTAGTALGAGSPAAARAATDGATKAVTYRGHTFTVPADWQVVDLDRDPTACVRFDRHAVYLGTPGDQQDCPARAVGRTESLWVQPAVAPTKSAVTENRTDHVYRATAEGIAVTAAYGSDREAIRRVLDSAGLPVAAARTEKPAVAAAALTVPAVATTHRGKGFDACTAPGQTSMSAWKSASPYAAIGIYIGGVNRACGQAKLTAQWVQTQYAAGWRFFPLYVGPQSSTSSCGSACAPITDPAPEGRAAADDAAAQAGALGLGKGTVIYNDLEAYDRGATATAEVLGYLKAWTERLHELGYRSGAYGSVSSLVADLVANAKKTTLPDVIHFARWNDEVTTSDSTLPASLWADHQRIHQYAGNKKETWGGVTINIDRNQLDVGAGTS